MVKKIDNPLPDPVLKPHRKMEFDLPDSLEDDDLWEKKLVKTISPEDDFDLKISPDDDFDL